MPFSTGCTKTNLGTSSWCNSKESCGANRRKALYGTAWGCTAGRNYNQDEGFLCRHEHWCAEHPPASPTGQEGRIKRTLLLKTIAKENRNVLITVKRYRYRKLVQANHYLFFRRGKKFWLIRMLLQDSPICTVSDQWEIDSEHVKRLIIKLSPEKSVHTVPNPQQKTSSHK